MPPTSTSCSTPRPTRNPLPRGKTMPDTPVSRAARASLADLEDHGAFERRHIGPDSAEQAAMLGTLGFASRAALIDAVVPAAIRRRDAMGIGAPRTQREALARLRAIAAQKRVFT